MPCTLDKKFKYTGTFLPLLMVHDSALHGEWSTAGCKAHTNFADESVCLMANNVWN
jgi:hypothetical protein